MSNVIVSILGALGIGIAAVLSLSEQNGGWKPRVIIAGAVVGMLMLIVQCCMSFYENKAHDRELSEETSRYNKLRSQHESLQTQNKTLLEKIDDLTSENQKLKDIIMQPVLEYYEDGFRITKDDATGQFKSSYVYRSKRPSVAIRDVKVELEFDKLVMKANGIIRQRKGGVSNVSRGTEVVFDNDTNKITVGAKELPQDFEFIVEVVSDAPLKIVSNKFSPCR